MKVTDFRSILGATLDRQQNVISRRQLLLAGVDDMTIYRNIRNGIWQRLLPGIYLLDHGSGGTEHRRIAASLYVEEPGQLTGLTVLHWYGFRSAHATDKVHVLVPHACRRRSTGFVVVQRALALDEAYRDAGLYRVTSPARAVVDACRSLTQIRDVRAIVTEAVQAGHTSPHDIDRELRRAVRSRTGLARRALAEVINGVRSGPEAELRELTTHSPVLPEILWNPTLTTLDGKPLPTPDGWIDEVGVALEVDSSTYHSRDEGWTATLERHNALAALDVQVLHFTPREIRASPGLVRHRIEQAYRSRLASGARARVRLVSKGPLYNAQR